MTAVTDLLRSPAPEHELEGDALRAWLAERYALEGDAWVRVNLVAALGGQVVGADGTSDALTGGIDRVLLAVIRSTADVVLVGAGTLRAERLRMPARAALAVATRRGDLEPDRLPAPTADGRRTIVLCPPRPAGALRARLADAATVIAVDDPAEHPEALVAALRAEGLRRIVCEGGADLAGRLLAADAVDELDLTTAPVLTAAGPTLSAPGAAATLTGLLRDGTDRLYARWRLRER